MLIRRDRPARVRRVARCQIELVSAPWPFLAAHHSAALAHFERRKQQSPGFFNGRVMLSTQHAFGPDSFSASVTQIDFATFLYWRECEHDETIARDVFGSALLRSGDGAVLLGRQSAGNLNAGIAYAPGGFIDPRDVDQAGRIDIDQSIRRELAEETGLKAHDLIATPGYIVTQIGVQISIAVEFVSELTAHALREVILADKARESELADIVIVRDQAQLPDLNVAPYAVALVQHVLAPGLAPELA